MNNSELRLHPKNYKEVSEGIVFYFADQIFINRTKQRLDEEEFASILQELISAKTLVVTSVKKNDAADRWYSLYVGKYVLNFMGSDRCNFQCTSIWFGRAAKEKKDKLYKTKLFTIIPAGNVYAVYDKEIHPKTERTAWDMDPDAFNEILDCMEEYFDSDDTDDIPEEEQEDRIKISERFRRNIIRPFRDYTDKESWVEQYKQSQGEGIQFFKREYVKKNDKGSTYRFFSNDENADPEIGFFALGDRITIIGDGTGGSAVTGVLEDIDSESEDSVIFSIGFYHQGDDSQIPDRGKLVTAINDTQTKVRSRVIRSMERGKLESKYMYQTFDDFSSQGYEEIPDDLKDYLAEKMASKYPPNQMQLEAIIKGILTEDILLVLGPPGTGKTTVISFWVEYFIRKGQRVLISSQNNAAVDNVLARFGKMAETVRLGNENKVQDNCKEYLPQNKIATMQEHFNKNNDRVKAALEHDRAELEKYHARLSQYQNLYDSYYEKKKQLYEYIEQVKNPLLLLSKQHQEILELEEDIDELRDAQVADKIFMQTYETKGFFEKLLKRRIAKNVRKEIEMSVLDMEKLRSMYKEKTDAYNASVKEIGNYIFELRKKDTLQNYENAANELETYTELAIADEFAPHFESEIKSLYTHFGFQKDHEHNKRILMQEFAEIEKLTEVIQKTQRALSEWNTIVNNDRNDIMQNALLETCQIVGATCIGINSNRDFANVKFDVAIVDESGQIQIHNALIPMSRARKNLLLGDYKQIPPCANEEVVAACKADEIDTELLNMSFFEYLFETMRKKEIAALEKQGFDKSVILKPLLPDYKPEPFKQYDVQTIQNMIDTVIRDQKKLVNLNSQFRMPGNISDIISEWFYEGNYYSSYNMANFEAMIPGTDKPLVVISTSHYSDRYESQPSSKMGYQNVYEAGLIAAMVKDVIDRQPADKRNAFIDQIEDHIGIISAYGAQVRLIREHLKMLNIGIHDNQIRSMVASLDSFQGQERPLIFYSLTRSTDYKKPQAGRIGFMKELRRLNVAFTRCQKQLVIVGDIGYLSECMNMEALEDEGTKWPCENAQEPAAIDAQCIEQCAECPAVCERKFARFMRLLMQHVAQGAGDNIESEIYLKRNA